MKFGLRRRFSRRLLPALFGLLMLWAIAGVVVAERVVARYDTAVSATLTSVRELVALALEDVRREAWLLAHDPAVSDGMAESDWATLVRGALPKILALQQDRIADLLLIMDANGLPLIQMPPAKQSIAPAVLRPTEPFTQVALVGERPYVLGIAPTPAGMVVVGRSFDALEESIATLPSRPALVAVSNDRALGAVLPGAPTAGWTDALRTGRSRSAVRRGSPGRSARAATASGPCCRRESTAARRDVSGSGGLSRSPPRWPAPWYRRRLRVGPRQGRPGTKAEKPAVEPRAPSTGAGSRGRRALARCRRGT